jgi:uncharacterized protein YgiM (DUF1202 family)
VVTNSLVRTRRRESLRSEEGRVAEYVVILLVIVVLGGALAWALTRPKNTTSGAASSTTTTADPSVPPTLPPPKPYKVNDGVNVRGAPTTGSAVVGQVETGKAVLVVCRTEGQSVTAPEGSSNLWLRVTVGPTTGYVSALYVETGDDIDDATVIGVCGAV